MSVDQCIKVYTKMSKDIFSDTFRVLGKKGNAIRGKAWFSASKLERTLREVIQTYTGDDEATLVNASEMNPKCKV